MWCPHSVGRRKRPFQPFIIDCSWLNNSSWFCWCLSCLHLKTSSPDKSHKTLVRWCCHLKTRDVRYITEKVVPETLPGVYLHYTMAVLCSPGESINSVNTSLLEPLAAMRGYMVQTLSRSVAAAVCRNTHSPDEPEYTQMDFADTCQAATWASLTPWFWICSWAWEFQTLLQPLSYEWGADNMGEYMEWMNKITVWFC